MICTDFYENYIKLIKSKKSSYNKENLDNYLYDIIKNKNSDRINKIKHYIDVGFDINENITNKKINWIELAIYTNDIPLIGFLIKSNVNIHRINSNGSNLIFTCIHADNHLMLKHFINLGVNPNLKNNDSNTPLITSLLTSDGFECAKILLLDKNVNFTYSNKIFSLTDLVIRKIDEGHKEYLEILDLILSKKKKLDKNDMEILRSYTYHNEIEIVKVFLKNFPSCINKSSGDEDLNTIVHIAIYEEHIELLKYFFTFNNLDYKKKNGEDGNYLEIMCFYGMIEALEVYCKKYPKSLHITYNSHSIIDFIITTNDFKKIKKNKFEDVKKMIEIIVSNGGDINYRNDIGYTLIFPAIQFGNPELVKFMIEIGAEIREPLIVNDDEEYPSFINNDPIGFAVQLGHLEILKVLIEKNAIFHKVIKKNVKLYTCILLSIKHNRDDCFNYLIEIPKIKNWIVGDEVVKNYLLDYAMKNICTNKSILKHFVSESKLKSIDFSDPIYNLSLSEKKISINIDEYNELENESKLIILQELLLCIKIINLLFEINKSKNSFINVLKLYKELYFNITKSINENKEIKNIKDDFFGWINIFSIIISDRLDYHISENLKKIFEYVSKIFWEIPDDEDEYTTDSDVSNNFIKYEFNLDTYVKKIKKLHKLFYNKKKIFNEYKNELEQIIIKNKTYKTQNKFLIYDNKNFIEQDVVIKKLFKLYFPIKQPHYEQMYHSIVYNTDEILSTKNGLIVLSENKIKSTIFEMKTLLKPDFWIKTYAPNIGKEDKTDLYHMFPFALDSLLDKYFCIVVTSNDLNVPDLNIYKYYFHGMIEFNGKVETGCYEYFINSHGTLFHRMFKVWNLVPDEVKKKIKN